jgi:APA family basic amino acid/polyamine antiporter
MTPIIFIAIEVWFVFNTLFEKPAESLAGFAFILLGIPVYYFWKRKNSNPQA